MLFKLPGFGSSDPKNDASTDNLNPFPEVEPSEVSEGADASEDAPRRLWPRILIGTGLVAGGLVGGAVFLLSLLGEMVSCGGMFELYEGRSYSRSMNRAQQAHHLEQGSFAKNWDALGLRIEPVTQYYRLVTKTEGDLVLNYAIVKEEQIDDDKETKRDRQEMVAYVGAVAPLSAEAEAQLTPETRLDIEPSEDAEGVTTQAILCRAMEPGLAIPPAPQLVDGVLTCASGTRGG